MPCVAGVDSRAGQRRWLRSPVVKVEPAGVDDRPRNRADELIGSADRPDGEPPPYHPHRHRDGIAPCDGVPPEGACVFGGWAWLATAGCFSLFARTVLLTGLSMTGLSMTPAPVVDRLVVDRGTVGRAALQAGAGMLRPRAAGIVCRTAETRLRGSGPLGGRLCPVRGPELGPVGALTRRAPLGGSRRAGCRVRVPCRRGCR